MRGLRIKSKICLAVWCVNWAKKWCNENYCVMGIPLILSLIHFEGYDEKFEIFFKKSFAGAAIIFWMFIILLLFINLNIYLMFIFDFILIKGGHRVVASLRTAKPFCKDFVRLDDIWTEMQQQWSHYAVGSWTDTRRLAMANSFPMWKYPCTWLQKILRCIILHFFNSIHLDMLRSARVSVE